ncbi:hypothetical protein FWH09_02005 [Candidatus Saccharibacteria bacterium]|nr:hypothetical protein [Candidatus Saccharibacteria bacterium]
MLESDSVRLNRITKDKYAFPTEGELWVALVLAQKYGSIHFKAPSRIQSVESPDIKMDGLLWEIKTPEKLGKNTIGNAFSKAKGQSENVVFSLRELRMVLELKAIRQIESEFNKTKRVRRLIIVTRGKKLLTFEK